MLPGISITENISKDTVENNIYDRYQESYWRVTDLINTELLRSFNLDSSFVYGQATLTLKPYFYPSDSLVLDARGFRIGEMNLLKKGEAGKPGAGTPLKFT